MKLLDWIYPKSCAACRTLLEINGEEYFCARCAGLFEKIEGNICERCGGETENPAKTCSACTGRKYFFEHNRTAFVYDELMRDIINSMKFRNKKRIAEALGDLWAKNINPAAVPKNAILVPMPMHPKKQRERGFNQAEIMTRPLAAALKLPCEPVLIRTFDTPPQSQVHHTLRMENVADIFSVAKNFNPHGKIFILTDDIFTTGASLSECAKTLKNAGAAQVFSLTLTKTKQPTKN